MRRAALALSAFALLGCQTTDPAPAPLPDMQSIIAPSTEVPSGYGAFSGVWTGSWNVAGAPSLDGNFAVQTVSGSGEITGLYAVGDAARGQFKAQSFPVTGTIAGDTLTLAPFKNGARVSYTLLSDGSLAGRYILNGQATPGHFTKLGNDV